jgi:hypothetical protein
MKVRLIAISAVLAATAAIATTATVTAARPGAGSYVPVTERGQAAAQIIRKWAGYVQQVHRTSPTAWSRAMGPLFAQSDVNNMKRAAQMTTYEGMMATLVGQRTTDQAIIDQMAKSDGSLAVIQALGSPSSDLVFTSITPCRILDTRLSGGAIATDGVRDFNSSGLDFMAQGGSDTDCSVPADASAVLVNVTVVDVKRQGYLTLYPYGVERPLASQLNYNVGDIKGNEVIVKQTLGQPFDFSIYANGETDVVADIAGYFMAPVAGALECITANGTQSQVAAGAAYSLTATCPTGYAVSGGGVRVPGGSTDMTTSESYPQGSTSWLVNGRNTSGASQTMQARANCCRVPGR